MAKLPRYMELKPVPNGLKPSLTYKLTIKRWGVPIIIYKCLKKCELKWYMWPLYPYVCFKVLRGYGNG